MKDNQLSTYYPLFKDNIHLFAWSNLFTKEECEKIKKYIYEQNTIQAGVIGNGGKGDTYSPEKRKSNVSWVFPNDENSWVFEKIKNCILDLNNKFFKFDIQGLSEGLQYCSYKKGDFFIRHPDRAYGIIIRKLSLTIQLSDEKDYKGGELVLYNGLGETIVKKEQGHAVVFPSFVEHEVKPVTKGKRESLVAWITGPQFK